MESRQTASARITEEVTSWPGVTANPWRRGEFAFRVGRREIGHLHGDHAAHFGFPKDVWHALFDRGGSTTTRSSRNAGFGARRIETDQDVAEVIALMRPTTSSRPAPARRSARPPDRGALVGIVTVRRAASASLSSAPS